MSVEARFLLSRLLLGLGTGLALVVILMWALK